VVAPLSFLNEHMASWTALPILKVTLKVGIARSQMLRQHALPTKL
jgi:hypothetical protein